jgi:major membrane immunogen (membrane-anchored lipoprotein)
MGTRVILAATAAIALAACGGSDKGDGNQAAGTQSAAAGGASGMNLNPGQWETTVEMKPGKVPGMPAGMGSIAMPKTTVQTCMTAEDAKGPKGDMFTGKKDGNCTNRDFSMSGGRLRGTVTCSAEGQGGETVMVMDGRYSPDSFDVTMKVSGKAGGAPFDMEMHSTGRRIGECPAGKG